MCVIHHWRAMNTWLPQASYPCGNFSDTSSWIFLRPRGSIGHVFTVCIHTENQNGASSSPCGPHEISVLIELTFGHLRYHLTDVPPQPNSPPDYVFRAKPMPKEATLNKKLTWCKFQFHGISEISLRVLVFQDRQSSHLCYTSSVNSQSRTRVKLNRAFFPR